MEYTKRNILDRIAVGDDCFRMDKLSDGRYRLTPAPDSVVEEGTNIDRNLLQPMEDAIEWLVKNAATSQTFTATIPISGWTNVSPYSVQIKVEGVLSTDKLLINAALTGDETADSEIKDAWNMVSDIDCQDGYIIVYADQIPTAEIPIQMLAIR